MEDVNALKDKLRKAEGNLRGYRLDVLEYQDEIETLKEKAFLDKVSFSVISFIAGMGTLAVILAFIK